MARQALQASGVKVVLIGAGGHAKAVVEALRSDYTLVGYVDPRESAWLEARWLSEQELSTMAATVPVAVVLGFGGMEPQGLAKRLSLLDTYRTAGLAALSVIHPAAHVSPSAKLADGVTVLAGAVVQPGAMIGRGAIINTLSVVEHDSEIGEGSHVAPGAIVLGRCRIGDCCMVGAGAIVLPGSEVPPKSLIAAGTRYPS